MPDPLPLLSVVSPAFNEEAGLPHFHSVLAAVLDQLSAEYRTEIVYVDDGSGDGTLGVLRHLASEDSRVRYLSLSRNFGNQAALTAGLEHTDGDAVVTMDSGLQHPPNLIPTLVEKWREGYDVALTVRADGGDRTQNWISAMPQCCSTPRSSLEQCGREARRFGLSTPLAAGLGQPLATRRVSPLRARPGAVARFSGGRRAIRNCAAFPATRATLLDV